MSIAPGTLQERVAVIAQICAAKGVRNFIIAPGSRSAPLTIAISRHPQITCRAVYDERSAAYIALGLAQQLQQPVGLICTSGTATLNFAPAVTEAFYQQIPLLVLTADRPPEWLDQQNNQTIHQFRLYEPHCRGSYELPEDTTHPDARWFVERTMADAINRCQGPTPGPVHVNIPLREPVYPTAAELAAPLPTPRIIQAVPPAPDLSATTWDELLSLWHGAKRKLIVGGMHPADAKLNRALQTLGQDPTVAVIGDVTANLYPHGTALAHSDIVLGTRNPDLLQQLLPDLVVTFGGQYTSKYLRTLLRRQPPQVQWHLQLEGNAIDTLQSLTHLIPMRSADFFEQLSRRTCPESGSAYASLWQQLETEADATLTNFLEAAPFGEFQATYQVMRALPSGSRLQLGNSMPVRYGNFIGYTGVDLAQINSNRGTSGIDGTVSTTVGAALATDALTTLIVGDLAFFYDRNGLWHAHLPPNLRIVLLNNHGGGIFQIIDGPGQLPPPVQETFFLTPQPLNARRTAEDHNCAYFFADNAATLAATLPQFFAPNTRAAILEIETDMATNTAVFAEFRKVVANFRM